MVSAVKAGRCRSSFHRDRGKVVHAVPPLKEGESGCWMKKALCGIEPGRKSYGWDHSALQVNCPVCQKRLKT